MKTPKITGFLLLVFLISSSSFAQDGQLVKNAYIFKNENEFRQLRAEGIELDKSTGNVMVALTQLDYASKLKKKGMFVGGTESVIFNRLLLFNFDDKLVYKGLTGEAYSMNGGDIDDYQGAGLETEKVSTKPYVDLVKNYPWMFTEPSVKNCTVFSPYDFGIKKQTKVYDPVRRDFYLIGEPASVIVTTNKPVPNVTPSHKVCFDGVNQTVTTYFGKETEEKYGDMKYLLFATYDVNGTLLNTCEANLPFPRNLSKASVLRSKSNPDQVVGKVFFFERYPMIGKKYNDPEKNNYELVAIDKDGKLMLYKSFKVGDPDKSDFTPLYAVADGSTIWVLAEYTSKASYGLMVKTFDASGNETTKEITSEALSAKKVYDKNITKRSSSAFDGVGITFRVSENFDGLGHVIASNGDILVWGRTWEEIDDPNYKPNPQMASMFKPQVPSFKDFVCFQINPSNELVSLYGALMKDNLTSTPIKMSVINNKVLFSTYSSKGKISELEPKIFSVPALSDNSKTWTYPYPELYTPKFIAINPLEGKISSHSPEQADFTLFNLENYSLIVPERSALYYYGYSLDRKDINLKLLIEEFKF